MVQADDTAMTTAVANHVNRHVEQQDSANLMQEKQDERTQELPQPSPTNDEDLTWSFWGDACCAAMRKDNSDAARVLSSRGTAARRAKLVRVHRSAWERG